MNNEDALKIQLIEALEAIVYACGSAADDGWYDSMCLSHVVDAGDRLVVLGVWERRVGGCRRRQFYRPIL